MKMSRMNDVWIEMNSWVLKGYDAIDKGDYSAMTDAWLKAWEILKNLVEKAEFKLGIIDVEEAVDYEYAIEAWLQDMEMELANAKEYEKRLLFCREVLDAFDWRENDDGGFKMAIGESLYSIGKKEEGEKWFLDWLAAFPHDVDALNGYSICLAQDGKVQQAFDMLESEVGEKDCDWDNEILFVRLSDLAERLGNRKKSRYYKRKLDELKMESENIDDSFMDEIFSGYSISFQQPVVKPEKIYPNDPCPCGSGKKYKKCCGRNI